MAGISASSAIQASLQGVIDALNQGDCKEARRLLSRISAIDSMQRGFMGSMLVNPSITISDKIQKIVEMADKKWKIQLKAPELAGRVEGKAPAAAPVPQAAVARALPASAAAAPASIPVASDPPSILQKFKLSRSGALRRRRSLYAFARSELAIDHTALLAESMVIQEKRLENMLARRAIQKEIVCLEEGLFRNRLCRTIAGESYL